MLEVALEFREVVQKVCERKELGLRAYELSEREWEIAEQLSEILEVRERVTFCHLLTAHHDPQSLLFCTSFRAQIRTSADAYSMYVLSTFRGAQNGYTRSTYVLLLVALSTLLILLPEFCFSDGHGLTDSVRL